MRDLGHKKNLPRVCFVGDIMEVFVCHEGRDATAHLMVVHVTLVGAKENEQEPNGNGNLEWTEG